MNKARTIEVKVFALNNDLDRLCDGLISWKEKWYEGEKE